jgi:endonuclease-3
MPVSRRNNVSKIEALLIKLEQFYGLLSAPPRAPFMFFVWEVLSVHSTPVKVEAAMAALKRALALTPDAMSRAPRAKLEAAVKLAGSYTEQRMQALRTGVDIFRRAPKLPEIVRGPLPAARRAIKPLPQLGEAGAHRMLLFAADHPVLPVDARVNRVGRRLGYGSGSADFRQSAKSVQRDISAGLTGDVSDFRRAYLYLSHHGASTCTDADPHCTVCPLLADCPEGKKRVHPRR